MTKQGAFIDLSKSQLGSGSIFAAPCSEDDDHGSLNGTQAMLYSLKRR